MIDGKLSPILRTIYRIKSAPSYGSANTDSIILTAVFIGLVEVVLKTTNLRLYVESVGINPSAARLNVSARKDNIFDLFNYGSCTAVAGFIAVKRRGAMTVSICSSFIMMDAILAVAIGGNSLGGGKFSITGSIIGAYTIEMLNRTCSGWR
jgi:simple sugar transport system permease protein